MFKMVVFKFNIILKARWAEDVMSLNIFPFYPFGLFLSLPPSLPSLLHTLFLQ